MTKTELDLLKRASAILASLIAEPTANPPRWRCPVQKFAETYLQRESGSDLSSAELWSLYSEIVATGELEGVSKAEFCRRLTGAMEAVFGVRKAHNLSRERGRVRGFRGVGYRPDDRPITAQELEPPIEPEIDLPEPDLDPKPPSDPMPMTFVRTSAPRI
jgi:hypothetical protein